MIDTAPALDAVVVLSAAAAVAATPKILRGPVPRGAPARRVVVGPGAALAVVVALIYLNQVLFTVYVLRVHGGDTSFVARHLPPGWFETADGNAPVRWLAAHVPAPELLAPSVLRVQAFLELPFVLLAFATVLRWLDGGLYRRVARSRLVPLASASYTLAFCLVEWDLRNPYTVDDIVLRVLSALVTPALVAALAKREPLDRQPVSAVRLLLFGVSLWALGRLVLVLYDTALLYDMARLGGLLPGATLALAVLAAARHCAARTRGGAPAGPAVRAVSAGLGRALTLFFVPALAIRYGVSFGSPQLAAGAGGLILLVAFAGLLRERRGPVPWAALAPAAAAGAFAGGAAARWTADAFYEATLLRAATAFLLTAIGVCAAVDALRGRDGRAGGAAGAAGAGAEAAAEVDHVRKRADSPP